MNDLERERGKRETGKDENEMKRIRGRSRAQEGIKEKSKKKKR
jgi:hypothetical protein